jgi:hypothetical protein
MRAGRKLPEIDLHKNKGAGERLDQENYDADFKAGAAACYAGAPLPEKYTHAFYQGWKVQYECLWGTT